MALTERGDKALAFIMEEAEQALRFYKGARRNANKWLVNLKAVPIIAGVISAILSVLAGTLKSPDNEPNVNLTITLGISAAVLTALTSASASILTGFRVANWYRVRSEGETFAQNILTAAKLARLTAADDEEAFQIAEQLRRKLEILRRRQHESMSESMQGQDSPTQPSSAPRLQQPTDEEPAPQPTPQPGPANETPLPQNPDPQLAPQDSAQTPSEPGESLPPEPPLPPDDGPESLPQPPPGG